MSDRRRTFGPVVVLGLAAGILAAVASNRPWVVTDQGSDPLGTVREAGMMPLASALSLVLLACWGVLLVTRGLVRRGVAVLGLLAAAGLAITAYVGLETLPDAVYSALAESGQVTDDTDPTQTGGWFWAAAVGATVSIVTTALAVAWCPAWPEMGSRYDAPGTANAPSTGDRTNVELWKSLDEGRDPTA